MKSQLCTPKKNSWLLLCSLALLFFCFLLPVTSPNRASALEDQPWWMTPQRMIQTNLREIDAQMDLDDYIESLKTYRANVVLFNVGGIVANYPTDLPFHYRNPFMKNDFTGEVVERLHREGMRIIGRFDFSKVNERIAQDHPEWLYISEKGETVNYNGQVHTCLNGGYQQDALFQILGEAIDRYPLDGIFFNMIGYVQSDYSGNYHGICQCQNCRERFREMYSLDLPKRRDNNDPVYQKYEEFRRRTIDDQFLRVQEFVKAKNPNLAICTYTTAGVDITRMESNTPHGEGTYADSDKARNFLLANPDHMLANTAVHFIDFPQRHSGVSTQLTRRRLLQHLVNGTWVDFYCIGPLHTLEDRLVLDVLQDVYHFHAENEKWLLDTTEIADAGLVIDGMRNSAEYRGLFKILSESQISFDLVSLRTSDLAKYPLLIVPMPDRPDRQLYSQLDDYVSKGGRLLITGPVPDSLKSTGIIRTIEKIEREKGTYIRIETSDKQRLEKAILDKLDLVFLDGDLWTYETEPDVEGLLRFIPPAMFGPPEKCYYTQVSEIPCLYYRKHGEGAAAFYPWRVGEHYERQGHPGHAALIMGAIDHLLQSSKRIVVDAPSLVEINHRSGKTGEFEWISLINHSGLLENVLHEPVPIRNITLQFKTSLQAKTARLLKANEQIPLQKMDNGWIRCTVPELSHYEIVLFEE